MDRKKDIIVIDLLVKNGRTIDNQAIEIAIKKGKIVEVNEKLDCSAKETINLKTGTYISSGWIDDHVHGFEKMDLYYDYPDKIGVESGVTTIIDAGTTGSSSIEKFYPLAKEAKTNVFALLNISKWRIVEQDELADLKKVEPEEIKQALETYPDFIVGLKVRMSRTVIGENGLVPLKMAKEIQKDNGNLPLMIHIGSAPPQLNALFSLLDPGDIITHIFNGKDNGILEQENQTIKKFVLDHYNKGLLFDLGHGTDSFDFNVAEQAFKEGIKAHTISTDIYSRNRIDGPVFNFATTLEKLRLVGYSWSEIIDKATSKPAEVFSLVNKAKLEVGKDADLTIFNITDGNKTLVDSKGNKRQATELIHPLITIIGGDLYRNSL